MFLVKAVPATSKHQIEINCNPRDAIMLEKTALENVKMFKKLKEVIDKIKRINSTTMLHDPKLSNFTDDATAFIRQSVGRLLNLTEKVNSTLKTYKMSKELMEQINNLTRIAPNKTTEEGRSKEGSGDELEINKILESKHELNLTYIKDKYNQMNNINHKLVTVDDYVNKKANVERNLTTEKDWINVLDTLNDELDEKEISFRVEATRTTTRPTTRPTSKTTHRYVVDAIFNSLPSQERSMNLKEIVAAAVLPNAQKQATDITGNKKSSAGI